MADNIFTGGILLASAKTNKNSHAHKNHGHKKTENTSADSIFKAKKENNTQQQPQITKPVEKHVTNIFKEAEKKDNNVQDNYDDIKEFRTSNPPCLTIGGKTFTATPNEELEDKKNSIDKMGKFFKKAVKDNCNGTKIEPELIYAMVIQESNTNNQAKSSKGALGLMQIQPETALHIVKEKEGKFLPYIHKVSKKDPQKALNILKEKLSIQDTNISIGVKYFDSLLTDCNGDTKKALAAYNAGPNKAKKHGEKTSDGVPRFPQTQKYVFEVLELYNYLKNNKTS